jgi:hypothetical protein
MEGNETVGPERKSESAYQKLAHEILNLKPALKAGFE